MRVWIDQDLCTGDGLCAEICPDIFYMHDDGLAYVKEEGDKNWNPPKYEMAEGTVPFSEALAEAVIESADECPGECIFIESD
jgi:ferredoxin